MDEGLARFWKGAQVIASGCVPAHASYFCMYEFLKKHFAYKNDKYEIVSTACIGSLTTFAHDFFIAPTDGIHNFLILSREIKAIIMQKPNCTRMCVSDNPRRRFHWSLLILPLNRLNEYPLCNHRCLCQWESQNLREAMGKDKSSSLVLPMRRDSWGHRWSTNKPLRRGEDKTANSVNKA
jgi:hypothetical protein